MPTLGSEDSAWMLAHGQTVDVTVIGTSMEPTIPVGTTVVVAPLAPDEPLALGDVVLFIVKQPPALVVHRVVGLVEEGPVTRVFHGGERARWAARIDRARILGRVLGVRAERGVVAMAPLGMRAHARLRLLQLQSRVRRWGARAVGRRG